ncbi:MAG: serine/threonine protein kinase [Lentisphaeria bacterium]|jgi:serine/threonine protein kinase
MTTFDENDKTCIAPRGAISANNAGSKSDDLEKDKPNTLEKDQRRVAAQKKARELEKRLAIISAKKNKIARKRAKLETDAQNGGEEANNEFDISSLQMDNKTRIQSHSSPQRNDKTQIQAKQLDDDRAQLQKKQNSLIDEADKTRFAVRVKPESPSSSATLFKPASRDVNETHVISQTEIIQNKGPLLPLENARGSTQDADQNEAGTQDILKNRFVFEKILGSGGMGMVYKAKDLLKVEAQDKDPYVAIKVLSDEFKTHPEAFIALQRESRKTQRIAHPNIVNVHDFDRDGDTVFMTMEFLDGKPLDKLISQYKSTGLPEDDAWSILQGISAALVHAHAEKIIHSDFKPGNIFVTNKGLAKVFDFGIARAVAKAEKFEDSVDDKTVFDAGNLGALTPAYASLEMLEGHAPDVRDDVYALGCIAYEMFAGYHPFNRVHANEAMRLKFKPKRINSITKNQWKVIEKALAFERADRIESVEEFWKQLTHKKRSKVLVVSISLLVIGLIGALAYQNYFKPTEQSFSEDDVRSEIELKLRIEQNQATLGLLIANQQFDDAWETRVWSVVQEFRKLLGDQDSWLINQESLVYTTYIDKIRALVGSDDFPRALSLFQNVSRYTRDNDALNLIQEELTLAKAAYEKRKEDEKKQQELALARKQQASTRAVEKKKISDEFIVAEATVNKQLQCRSTMNMGDLGIAITKLRSLDINRYKKSEGNIVTKLAACISKIGRSFPERAEEHKKRALRLFPRNKTIAYIKIQPKDPCDIALAGLGARGERAECRDRLKDKSEDLGRGPSMVVIPKKGSVSEFAIGKYEITVEDINKYCAVNKQCEVITGLNEKLPITNIPFTLINNYLQWLSEKSEYKYRLPTKAEWTYAARAEGSKLDSNRNCRLNSRGIQKGGLLIRASVGKQNTWGLVNHVGNASELVANGSGYVSIGGSFETSMEECSVTLSSTHDGQADSLTGFRVVREIATY